MKKLTSQKWMKQNVKLGFIALVLFWAPTPLLFWSRGQGMLGLIGISGGIGFITGILFVYYDWKWSKNTDP